MNSLVQHWCFPDQYRYRGISLSIVHNSEALFESFAELFFFKIKTCMIRSAWLDAFEWCQRINVWILQRLTLYTFYNILIQYLRSNLVLGLTSDQSLPVKTSPQLYLYRLYNGCDKLDFTLPGSCQQQQQQTCCGHKCETSI